MEASKCFVCKKVGKVQACGKCRIIHYCSRECQLGHWKTHKKECISPDELKAHQHQLRTAFFNKLNSKIAGNALIMSAWYKKTRGSVSVEVSETLEDISEGGSNHFLHITYNNLDDDNSTEYDKYSDPNIIVIEYTFTNHTETCTIASKIADDVIQKKYPKPSDVWSIVIDL